MTTQLIWSRPEPMYPLVPGTRVKVEYYRDGRRHTGWREPGEVKPGETIIEGIDTVWRYSTEPVMTEEEYYAQPLTLLSAHEDVWTPPIGLGSETLYDFSKLKPTFDTPYENYILFGLVLGFAILILWFIMRG